MENLVQKSERDLGLISNNFQVTDRDNKAHLSINSARGPLDLKHTANHSSTSGKVIAQKKS